MPRCLCILCAAAAALLALMLLGTPAALAGEPVSFIRDVAPVLQKNCFSCHDARKKSGKYDLTTFEKLTAGGTNGEPIVPGEPAESDFHFRIVSPEADRMPPPDKGDALSPAEAKLIERWIREGAKPDAGLDVKADLVRELRSRWTPPVSPLKYQFPVVVQALAFTPDGQRLVVGGHHELTVWSAAEGKLLRRVRTRAERAYGMAFLPDGLLAVAGGRPGQEGDLCLYDLAAPGKTEHGVTFLDGVADPKVLRARLVTADDSILCVAVSPDGRTLAAGGCDRVVRVWDLSAGVQKAKLTQTIENHADWVLGVAIAPSGELLATAARDRTAKVWNLKTRESVSTFPGHQGTVYDVAFSPDAAVGYSVGADKQLQSWKPAGEGKPLQTAAGHGDEVLRLSSSPDGAVLATASADRTVRLWDAKKLSPTRTLPGLTDFASALAFSPDGRLVAGGSAAGEVTVWRVADGNVVKGFNASPGFAPR